MPIVTVHILQGRTFAQKRDACAAVAEALQRTLGGPLAAIRVLITESPAEHWSVGGVIKADETTAERPALTTRTS